MTILLQSNPQYAQLKLQVIKFCEIYDIFIIIHILLYLYIILRNRYIRNTGMNCFIYKEDSGVDEQSECCYIVQQSQNSFEDSKKIKRIQKIQPFQIKIKSRNQKKVQQEEQVKKQLGFTSKIQKFQKSKAQNSKKINTNTLQSNLEIIFINQEFKKIDCDAEQSEIQEIKLTGYHHQIQPIIYQESQQIPEFIPIYKKQSNILSIKSKFIMQRLLFFPEKFHMYIKDQHILTARRKIVHSNSLYFFFTDIEDLSTKSKHYVGYMQSNYDQNQYSIFTKQGIQLALITYIIKQNKANQVRVYIPSTYSQRKSILQSYRESDKNIMNLYSKVPKYDSINNKFKMNFKGRAKMSSMKNCVIEFQNQYALIIGKQSENIFNLDFGFPFSEMTAFGFAVSNHEDKVQR